MTASARSAGARSAGRGILAGILVVLGLLALAVAALVWTPTHNVVTRDGFTDATVAALRTSVGREAISAEIERAVNAELRQAGVTAPARLRADLSRAIQAVVADSRLEALLRDTISNAYTQVVEEGRDELRVDLGALRDSLAEQVALVDPSLVDRLPSREDLGTLRVSLDDRLPEAGQIAEAADLARIVPPIALAVGIVLVGLGVAVSARRGRTARNAAFALLAIAAIPVAIRLAGPAIARSAARDEEDGVLAEQVAVDALAGWWVALAAALLIAAALVVVWLAAGSGGRSRRSPAPVWYE